MFVYFLRLHLSICVLNTYGFSHCWSNKISYILNTFYYCYYCGMVRESYVNTSFWCFKNWDGHFEFILFYFIFYSLCSIIVDFFLFVALGEAVL